jgi:hypothetical protein
MTRDALKLLRLSSPEISNPSAFFTAGPTGPTGPADKASYIIETKRIEFRLKKTSDAFLEMERHIMSGDTDQIEKCEQTIQLAVERIGELLHTVNPVHRTTVLSNALRVAYASSPNITEWYPDMMSLYMNHAEELDGELVASDNSDDDEPNMEVVHSSSDSFSASARQPSETPSTTSTEFTQFPTTIVSGNLHTDAMSATNDNVGRFETAFTQYHYEILYRNPFDKSEDPRPYTIL